MFSFQLKLDNDLSKKDEEVSFKIVIKKMRNMFSLSVKCIRNM